MGTDHMSQPCGYFLYLALITSGMSSAQFMQYDSTGAWIVVSSGMSGVRASRSSLWVPSSLFPQVIGYPIMMSSQDERRDRVFIR